jgi:hypothetical protein
MAQVEDSIASSLEPLAKRVQELEGRVAALESQAERSRAFEAMLTGATQARKATPQAARPEISSAEIPGGAIPTLGRAVLGMAGAFLLRAVAESGSIPKLPVLFVGIVYAAFWMVWSARIRSTSRFASAVYSITSVLILAPMLAESSLRFKVLPHTLAAVVLVAFVVMSLGLAWRQKLQFIPWAATVASVVTALALIIGTKALVPFTVALLAMALVTEVAVCLGQRLTLRAVPALAADLSVLLLVYVMVLAGDAAQGYPPVTAAVITALSLVPLAIYGGSIAVRGFALRRPITSFEVGQGIVALVLAAFGSMRSTQGSAAAGLGLLFLLLAAACYWGALWRFAEEPYARNRRISATWAAALLVVGAFLMLGTDLQIALLCLAALATAVVYTRTAKLTLGLHTSVYLAAAAVLSPLPDYVRNALVGTVPKAPHWSIWAIAICAALCYGVGSRQQNDGSRRRLLWVVPPALVGFAGAALLVAGIAALAASRVELSASRLSVVRTVVICALALTLGYLASRAKRAELGWVAYTVLAFGSLKLFLEDLRYGNAATLMVSLLFYGAILILLPRLTRRVRAES